MTHRWLWISLLAVACDSSVHQAVVDAAVRDGAPDQAVPDAAGADAQLTDAAAALPDLAAGDGSDGGGDGGSCLAAPRSNIRHLIILLQENHTFDNFFGAWCTGGAAPGCHNGTACCEAGPATEPATHAAPTVLDDMEHAAYSPNHSQACELAEMHGGLMDRYATAAGCGSSRNFAYAEPTLIQPYRDWATTYALADRYFQPLAGASSSNDMFFARAGFVFKDNSYYPSSLGASCGYGATAAHKEYSDPTIGDLLNGCGVSWKVYAGGLDEMAAARAANKCPTAQAGCPFPVTYYPCVYDPSDDPFEYYSTLADSAHIVDVNQLATDLGGTLPAVSLVRAIGWKSEHPGSGIKLSDGVAFVQAMVAAVSASSYAADTLILLTYDESGGYFDHIPPPSPNPADGQPYGPRVPLLALGPFARSGYISHVVMEHSSVVKFIEWNWLGATGQLHTRDANVNNLGSMLDAAKTGAPVPEGS